ncbi:MAG: TrmB family transcriptional regulator [Nitrososphaerota archaeon]|nr:TrmB family transcriptional regulator [Nitrososphaerota archaeon]
MNRADVVEQLKDVGLTSYEAKAYVALAGLGPSEPKKVASESQIPYPSAYTALRTLASKGWVEQVVKKPVTYRAKEPTRVRAMVSSRLGDTFKELERIYKSEPTEEAELVYTLRGRGKVLDKVYEMLRGAKQGVIVVAPSMGFEDAKIMELLAESVARGVEVRAICDDEGIGLLPPGVEIRTGNHVAFDLLVDDSVALIGLPDHSACGWVDSPAVASHLKEFLELLWSTSSPAG